MHPLITSARRFGLYVLAWQFPTALIAWLLMFSAKLTFAESVILCEPLCLLFAIVSLSPWYSCRVLPLRATPSWKLLVNHLLAAGAATLFSVSVARWSAIAIVKRLNPGLFARLEPHIPFLFVVGMLLYLLAVALHYTYLEFAAARDAVEREHQARVLAREAELKALKAQINPHFLFNCLNSISALTAIDPTSARDMCIRLSEFLRNTLRLGEKAAIPFADELNLVRAYLEVEQVRFGARLRVEQDIDDDSRLCMVPPLLLQPLVENAVKHGIAGLVDGGFIRIQAACVGQLLRITVENDFDPDSPPPRRSGLGLANVRSRIETRHGTRGHMSVTVKGTLHRVDLVLPREYDSAQKEAGYARR
jgi:two-component system sensor histidine kinase AlgZ